MVQFKTKIQFKTKGVANDWRKLKRYVRADKKKRPSHHTIAHMIWEAAKLSNNQLGKPMVVTDILRTQAEQEAIYGKGFDKKSPHQFGIAFMVHHEHDGKKYVYLPVMPRDEASGSALKHLVDTFFSGSQAATVSAILEMADTDLPDDELDRLEEIISRAREEDADR